MGFESRVADSHPNQKCLQGTYFPTYSLWTEHHNIASLGIFGDLEFVIIPSTILISTIIQTLTYNVNPNPKP